MKGQILDFSFQTNSGVIVGDDGNRYSFTGASWQVADVPQQGMRVDFDTDGSAATGIYVETAAANAGPGPYTAAPSEPAGAKINAAASSARQWFAIGKTAASSALVRSVGVVMSIPTKWLIIGGGAGGGVLLVVIVVVALLASGVIGGGNPQPISALDLVPQDARSVMRAEVQKVLAEDLLAEEFDIADYVDPDDLGVNPDDLSEMVVADWDSGGAIVLKGSFNLDDVREALEDQGGEEETYRGYEVWEGLDGSGAAALLNGYIVLADSARSVENVLKDLYNESGSLERADKDNAMQQVLNKLGRGYILFAAADGACQVQRCTGYGAILTEVDDDAEESKLEIALLFRNEDAAARAADDYDEVADFLELENGIDIVDTEADGVFVVGIAVGDLR